MLDVALESSTVPLRSRKRLITSFIGQFHLLADDRIGSRVADRCLKAADPYLKVLNHFFDCSSPFALIFSSLILLGKDRSLTNSPRTILNGISFRSIFPSESAFAVITTQSRSVESNAWEGNPKFYSCECD